MSTLTATAASASPNFPSVDYLVCHEPSVTIVNPNSYVTAYVSGTDTFNGGNGYPIRPGEQITIPIVGTQNVYFWAPTQVQLRALYQA